MYRLIISHETRSLARSSALWWILSLLVVAIAFGAWAGSRSIERQIVGGRDAAAFEDGMRATMRADVEKYAAQVDAAGGVYQFASVRHAPGSGPPQGTNAGAVGGETSVFAVLPPTGLAPLSVGQSDIQLNYIPVSMRHILDITKDLELENPVNLMTGVFDVAFVIIFLLPIFILAMTYDLLSSEKERGTLAMILAHPVSLRELMASKMISRAAILLIVVLTVGILVLPSVGKQLDSADTWLRFGLWIAATLLYSLFWFALAVLVNIFGRSSATNGILLAGGWLVFVVVVPTLVSLGATALYPAPSRMDLTVAARDAQTVAEKQYMQALDEYYYDHLELVPDGDKKAMDFLTLAMANSNSIEKAVRPLYDEFQVQLNRQEAMVQRFQFLSPAIMMQLALNEISGTSADRYEDFMRQVYDFHSEWKEYFTVRFLSQTPLRPEDYDRFPEFDFEEASLWTVLVRLMPSLLGLTVLLLGVLLIPLLGLRRYQVAAR